MKIGRMILAAVMVLLCAAGWITQVGGMIGARNDWQAALTEAQEYESGKLHQKAIESYERALSIREDSAVRQEMMEVCGLAYQEDAISRSVYKSALEKSCKLYPKTEAYWVRLVEFLRDTNSYADAHKALGRAERAGAEGESLAALNREITYAFTAGGQYFNSYSAAPDGYLAICNDERWGTVSPDGERESECDYLYVGPYSDETVALYCTEEESRLLDGKGVLQAVVGKKIEEAKAYGDGLLPVCENGKWGYLNPKDGITVGSYEDVSAYQDGTAMICANGTWRLVDTDGNPVSEQTFSDVRLFGNGDYSPAGLISASVDGAWNLYRTDGTPALKEFSARNLDCWLGGLIAYQDESGLWGFVDRKGKTVIEPQFQEARSFSGGLAAVSDGNQWGFINEKGTLAIDYQFQDAGYFSAEGACPVSTVDGEYHMIILRFPGGK